MTRKLIVDMGHVTEFLFCFCKFWP